MRCINDSDIGARLRKLRLDTGAKMIDIAVEFDISMAQYSRLESGKVRITVDVLEKACQYYHSSIDYILFGEEQTHDSIFFPKLQKFEEKDVRRFLKILTCLLDVKTLSEEEKNTPMYKMFAGGLLEMIPITASNAMPYVLEYEKNLHRKSENDMIRLLGLTRFKWNSIMHGTRVSDITIPFIINSQFGYDLDFLIKNKVSENLFFDDFYRKLRKERQKKVMKLFDEILILEEQELLIEVQKVKSRMI